jgi:carbamoyltransferase
MANISYYGAHNASLVVENNGEILCVIEIERFANDKNIGIAQYKPAVHPFATLEGALKWIETEYGLKEFETCFYGASEIAIGDEESGGTIIIQTQQKIPAKKYVRVTHHLSHAYGTFYQSPYNEALVISCDGGGDDGKFMIFHAIKNEKMEQIAYFINPIINSPHIPYDLGFPYMIFGMFLDDIKWEHAIGDGNLIWPGKIMGLVSYGKVQNEWLEHFIEFYKSNPDGGNDDFQTKLNILGDKIGITFDRNNRLKGQISYDVAATSQKAFEECFLEKVKPYFDKFPTLPICLTGGCALNIILNTRIVEEFNKKVFVGPNPSDCGLALGMMLKFLQPKKPFDATYSGIPILDKNNFIHYVSGYNHFKKLAFKDSNFLKYENADIEVLINDLIEGKIIGLIQGTAEHGPRALGNRSIICYPVFKDMKDILNEKVKNREWYRPFAPVVRLEDVNKYFEWDEETRWMSFSPKVRKEWQEKLPSITHIDGTARVQTVTKEQNEMLYFMLTELDKKTGVGVLLNTSFNVQGKPITSTYKDAFELFHKTQLDCLLFDEYYYLRKQKF